MGKFYTKFFALFFKMKPSKNDSALEWLTILKKKYSQDIKRPRQSTGFLISYLTGKLDCVPQPGDFMGEYFLHVQISNAYHCVLNELHRFDTDDFVFRFFTIIPNNKSHVYYKEMEHGETIYVILEEKTGYIESNCNLLFLELSIERGIDELDLALENDFCKAYFTYLEKYKTYAEPI